MDTDDTPDGDDKPAEATGKPPTGFNRRQRRALYRQHVKAYKARQRRNRRSRQA